ncbi:MAG: fasciclin domain-containing protein [Prevotellaceae bacterium]|nr:fasciclin domain-containing protein [Prevotellaceae bacterium]
MDIKIKNTFRMGIIAAAGAAAMVSCSDTWDAHYGAPLVTDYEGTTMQAIEEKAPDFAEVIKAAKFNLELESENVYTVWAPTSFDKDSVLRLLEAKDTTAVVEQFIKNHVARYPISALPGDDKRISLMSLKHTTMVGDETFGSANITLANLSCTNGVIHVIDNSIPYQYNIYELMKSLNGDNMDENSLYAFLHRCDSDYIDEDRSISHGVDSDGNKIWVTPYYIHRNSVLDAFSAEIYEEDSSYIAIIPSVEAYKKRFETARSLLNYNPSLTEREAILDSMAHLFAMTDLFYNRNANIDGLTPDGDGLQYDSLKSVNYWRYSWPDHLYYSKVPAKGLHPDAQVNDILAKSGKPIACSNGVVYEVDEYPISVTEQFFKKIVVMASNASIDTSEDSKYTKQVASNRSSSGVLRDYEVDTIWVDEEKTEYERIDSTFIGERNYYFCDIVPNGNNNPYVAFQIPNTLSGTYEMYVVTCPIWAKNGFDGHSASEDPRGYHFQVNIYERGANNSYGSSVSIVPPEGTNADGRNFITDYTNKIDTLYLGDYTFKNAYYGRNTEGALIQFYSYVPTTSTSIYAREMLISSIILRPKFEATDEDVVTEAKRK